MKGKHLYTVEEAKKVQKLLTRLKNEERFKTETVGTANEIRTSIVANKMIY